VEPLLISKGEARKIILHAAGLASTAQFGHGPEAVFKLIDHLGFVQLDTNYVVERAHHHVFAARVPDYQPQWLAELRAEGRIFEYFSSDAGYLPMQDFRFTLPVKDSFALHGKPLSIAENRLKKEVLNRIEREGPLMVGDFDDDRLEAGSGWWDWRPAKVALERLYLEGELMITRSQKFQKIYDLPLNLIPAETDISMPSPEEFARYIIRRTLGALGIASVKEMAWRARRVKGNLLKQQLEEMLAEAEIRAVTVEGLKSPGMYLLTDQQTDIQLSGEAFILSPFDILNVFRHRLKDFFDFDYQIECFVPAPKRKYGYFSLPVLLGDVFVARMDAKADRKEQVLIVHNLHFEAVTISDEGLTAIISAIKAFILFNGCRDVVFNRTNKEDNLAVIKKAFH
jgi:uncharacterized protein YcaQ